jgi:uncharacterized protein (DUF1330 family)
MNAEFAEAKITKSTSVFIRSSDPDYSLAKPVYAINWFNTRFLWLYNFYNMLGSVSVKKVGGTPIFKGRVKTVLHGEADHRRDVVLLVNYPAIENFRQMLESRYFQLVSVLRMLAVKEFTFGFSKPTIKVSGFTATNENKVYAMHHYQGDIDIAESVVKIIENSSVGIFYSGRITSLLFAGDEQVPCLMTGMILLEADNEDQIEAIMADKAYMGIVEETKSSFIATLSRVF